MTEFRARLIIQPELHAQNVAARNILHDPTGVQVGGTIWVQPWNARNVLQDQSRKNMRKYPLVKIQMNRWPAPLRAMHRYRLALLRGVYELSPELESAKREIDNLKKGKSNG